MAEPSRDIGSPNSLQPTPLSCKQDGQSTSDKLRQVINTYLSLFGKILPQGTIILKKPDNTAVSEGIGFAGLLFSHGNDKQDQQSYWQIYKARKAYFLKPNGVMAYLIDSNGKVVNRDSAPDGDQDWIASSLIILEKLRSGKWQLPPGMTLAKFEQEIQKDLAAFWKVHVRKRNNRLLFLSTDGAWAKRRDGKEIYYPSYPDPHFLRMFAKFDKKHNWVQLADDVQDLNLAVLREHKKLGATGQNPMPAKVFVSVLGNSYIVENYYTISAAEGVVGKDLQDNEMDSIRFVSLRMPRAAILDKDPKAKKILQELLKIANVSNEYSAHILAGSPGAPSTLGWNNTLARSSYGAAVLGSGKSTDAAGFFCSVRRDYRGRSFGESASAERRYYDQSLILQTLHLVFDQANWSEVARIDTPQPITPPPKTEQHYPVLPLPKGFKSAEAIAVFIQAKKDEIGKIEGRIGSSSTTIGTKAPACNLGADWACGLVNKERANIFREEGNKYLLQREIGIKDPSQLQKVVRYAGAAKAYDKARFATILMSGKPNKATISALKALGYGKSFTNIGTLSLSQKYSIYQEILSEYQTEASLTSPLLEGEVLQQMSHLAYALGQQASDPHKAKAYVATADKHRQEAVARFNKYIDPSNDAEIKKVIAEISPHNQENELAYSRGQARMLKAQSLIMQTNNMGSSAEALSLLKEAYVLFREAAQGLKGLHLLQTNELAAESLIRQAFILKNQGKPSSAYVPLFRDAEALLYNILNWQTAYSNKIPKNQPLWLGKITFSSKLWLAKAIMVKAGEEKASTPIATLHAQNSQLKAAANILEQILRETEALVPQEIAEVQRTLAENIARQAFTQMALGKNNYSVYFQKAKLLLEQASKQATPAVKAEVHLWQAKILLVEASKKKTKEAKASLFSEGLRKVEAALQQDALGNHILQGTVLSSAYVTKGELLIALKDFEPAEKALRKAVQIFPRNFPAQATLGDLLSSQGKYNEAISEYKKIPKDSASYPHALLGLAEATMRNKESYSLAAIETLEKAVKLLFTSEAPASPLMARAFRSWIEAYRTDEDLQSGIVYIAKSLGILNPEADPPIELTENNKNKLDDIIGVITKETRDALATTTKAEIYLGASEALLWGEKFDGCIKLLDEMPAALRTAIGDRTKLSLIKDLIRAEAIMRRDKDIKPLLALLAQHPEQIILEEGDANDAARITEDTIEAFMLIGNWEKAKEAAKNPLIPLETIREMFGDRKIGYTKFRLRILFKLVEIAVGGKNFQEAEKGLQDVLTYSQGIKETHLASVAKQAQAEAHLLLANIYSYNWKNQNFMASRNNYDKGLKLILDVETAPKLKIEDLLRYIDHINLSKRGRIILTKLLLGKGELFRYGRGLKNYEASYDDYKTSFDSYHKALKVAQEKLPKKSKQRADLLSQIHFGLYLFHTQEAEFSDAFIHLEEAMKYKDHTSEYIRDQMGPAYNREARKFQFNTGVEFRSIWGENGRNEFELRLPTTYPLPLELIHPWLNNKLHVSGAAQMAVSPEDVTLWSFFIGGDILPVANLDLKFGFQGKIGSLCSGDACAAEFPFDNPFERFRHLHIPDWKTYAAFGTKYISFYGEANIVTADSDRNAWHLSSRINPLVWTKSRFWSGLHVIADYNRYPFIVLDGSNPAGQANRLIVRDQVGAGLSYNIDILPEWAVEGTVKPFFHNPIEPSPGEIDPNTRYWQPGVEFGIKTDVYLFNYLKLYGSYTGQAAEYGLHTVQGGLNLVLPVFETNNGK